MLCSKNPTGKLGLILRRSSLRFGTVCASIILSLEFIGENMPFSEGRQKFCNREMKDVLGTRVGLSAEWSNLPGFGDELPLVEYEDMICQ